MNCPNCMIAYDPRHWEECPHCGADSEEPEQELELSGVIRTSTILIAAGNSRSALYRSVEDVPEPLRRLLEESTSGENSGTIYIADQRGRERIASALRDLPGGVPGIRQAHDRALAPVVTRFSTSLTPPAPAFAKHSVKVAALWIALMLVAVAGAVLWLVGGQAW